MTEAPRPKEMSAEDALLVEAIERALAEHARAKALSNQQLVEEILDRVPFGAWDEVVEEACTRLDPDWGTRDPPPPLTPEEQARLERIHEKGMARIQALLNEL